MAVLTTINQAGASLGDTFDGKPIIRVIADGVYVYGEKTSQGVELADLPTSMGISSVSGNQTGNGFTANGVYRSNNTGPLQNTGFGNWTWRVKATRIGDWIQHMYWNDTANIAFRESFDGGATWTAWAA